MLGVELKTTGVFES